MTAEEEKIREFIMVVDEVLTDKRNQPLYDEVIARIVHEIYEKVTNLNQLCE